MPHDDEHPAEQDGHAPAVDSMLEDLETLVTCESYSDDHAAVARGGRAVAALGRRLLGAPPRTLVIGGVTHVRWTFGAPRILLLGHHDTVWPPGSLKTRPWSVEQGIARGPGVFDMKAGLVQMFHALASLPSLGPVWSSPSASRRPARTLAAPAKCPSSSFPKLSASLEQGRPQSRTFVRHAEGTHRPPLLLPRGNSRQALDGICVLVTGDEETGSATSRALIEDTARRCSATLVLEPSAPGGALKTGRKGVSLYDIAVHGRAAHSGLDPEKGVNAAVELAHQLLALQGVADAVTAATGPGTTVTPTMLRAGTASNTVPALAELSVDVRVPTAEAQEAVDRLVGALEPRLPGARLRIGGGPNRPPLDPAGSRKLVALAGEQAALLGLGPLRHTSVGGASDGNFTAGVGCPTLDGLGAVGDGAHADHEHVVTATMPDRARLLARLVRALGDQGAAR